MKINKILTLLQLPPPFHGVSNTNKLILNKISKSKNFRIKNISLGYSNNLKELNKISIKKIYQMIINFLLVIFYAIFFRPNLAYLTLIPNGYAFYRDIIFIAIFRIFKIRNILHCHNIGFKKNKFNPIFEYVIKKILEKSDLILLSNTSYNLEKYHIDNLNFKKIHILNNGIEPPRLFIKAKKENPLTVNLLFFGNLSKSKGVYRAIQLAHKLDITKPNKFFLEIVGHEHEILKQDIYDYIYENDIRNVNYIGPGSDKNKYKIFSKTDILLYFSDNDNFPLVILEAMSLGVIVAALKVGSIPEIITNNYDGVLFDNFNLDISNSIIDLTSNISFMKIMSRNAQMTFENKFNSEIFLKNFIKIIS